MAQQKTLDFHFEIIIFTLFFIFVEKKLNRVLGSDLPMNEIERQKRHRE